jgi:hypothetical protein
MSLTDRDESTHVPPPGNDPTWQENCYFLGMASDESAGFLLHLARVPARNYRELKVAAFDRSLGVVSVMQELTDQDTFSGPGWSLDMVKPFDEWRISLSLDAAAGKNSEGLVAEETGGDSHLGIEVTITSPVPPLDFHADMDGKGVGDTDHYEAAGSWTGQLTLADAAAEHTGLFIRDHTWGQRDYGNLPPDLRFDECWWTPMYIPEREIFWNLTMQRRLSTGQWSVLYGLLSDADGTRSVSGLDISADPAAGIGTYERIVSQFTDPHLGACRHTGTARQHMAMRFSTAQEGRYLNEAFLSVDGTAGAGFGIAEYSNLLS